MTGADDADEASHSSHFGYRYIFIRNVNKLVPTKRQVSLFLCKNYTSATSILMASLLVCRRAIAPTGLRQRQYYGSVFGSSSRCSNSIRRTSFSRANPLLLKSSSSSSSTVPHVGGGPLSSSLMTTAEAAAATTTNISRSTLLKRAWAFYCNALEKRPLLTKASMASVIFFVSDSVTQFLLHEGYNDTTDDDDDDSNNNDTLSFQWDAARAVSAANFGVLSTTFLHYWWGFLEKAVGAVLVPGVSTKSRMANTAAKVLIHQSMGAPFYIYSYYVLTNFGQRLVHVCQDNTSNSHNSVADASPESSTSKSLDDVAQAWTDVNVKATHMLWPTMLRHWRVWPFVQSFNFYYTPLQHRVLVHNSVLMIWSGYLSYLNHNTATAIMTPGNTNKSSSSSSNNSEERIKVRQPNTVQRRSTLQHRLEEERNKLTEGAKTTASAPLESS